jgi:hypothetical protein
VAEEKPFRKWLAALDSNPCGIPELIGGVVREYFLTA